MTEFYSNLPQKEKDKLDNTHDRLVKTKYQEKSEKSYQVVFKLLSSKYFLHY